MVLCTAYASWRAAVFAVSEAGGRELVPPVNRNLQTISRLFADLAFRYARPSETRNRLPKFCEIYRKPPARAVAGWMPRQAQLGGDPGSTKFCSMTDSVSSMCRPKSWTANAASPATAASDSGS
jgi:hypothetical protein